MKHYLIACLAACTLLTTSATAQQQQRFVSPLKTAAPAPAAAAPTQKCLLPFDPLKLCGALTGKPQDDVQRIADRIRLALADDIDYAIAKATLAGTPASKTRLDCLKAIKAAHEQFTGAGLKRPDGSDWPRPDPAVLTGVEDVAELIDNLSPQGTLLTSCSGAASLVKMNALQFVNALVTGSAALAVGGL